LARDPRVQIIVEANTASLQAGAKAAEKSLDQLADEAAKLRRQFDSGEKTADEFAAGMARITKASETASKALGRTGATLSRSQRAWASFTTFLKRNVVVTFGEIARGVRAAFDAIRESADLAGQTAALKTQLAAQGQAFDAFLAKLDEVARGTVSTADLVAASSRALLLGIPADRIAELLEVARASAIATGTSIAKAFDDITTGIGRASPLILDNLGIMVNLTETYAAAAAQVGKTTEELTQQEKSAALLNAVLDVGASRVEAFGESQDKAAEAIARATAALADLRIKGFGGFAAVIITLIGTFKNLQIALNEVQITFANWSAAIELSIRDIPILGKAVDGLIDSQVKLAKAAENSNVELRRQVREIEDQLRALDEAASATGDATEATERDTEVVIVSNKLRAQTIDQLEEEVPAIQAVTFAQRQLNQELGIQIERKRLLSQIDEPRLIGPTPSTIGGGFSNISGGRFSLSTFQAGGRTAATLPDGRIIFLDEPAN
jgi:hypothetical protein